MEVWAYCIPLSWAKIGYLRVLLTMFCRIQKDFELVPKKLSKQLFREKSKALLKTRFKAFVEKLREFELLNICLKMQVKI